MTLLQLPTVPTPSVLYHYTTFKAFYEIINAQTLWASHINYMNDAKEFELAKEIATRLLEERLTRLPLDTDTAGESPPPLHDMLALLDGVIATDTYVISLSEEGNQLSQWRAYCRRGGVAIGFRTESLTLLMAHLNFFLAQCSYDTTENRNWLDARINNTLRLHRDTPSFASGIGTFWQNQIAQAGVFMKHPGFGEEREWRLVSHDAMGGPGRIKTQYRTTDSFLIPYRSLPLKVSYTTPSYDSNWPEVIASVRIGPTYHAELAINAVQRFLHANGIDIVPSCCGIPLREL